jgi:hypothetical protein
MHTIKPVMAAAQHHAQSTFVVGQCSILRDSPSRLRENPSESLLAHTKRDNKQFLQSNRPISIPCTCFLKPLRFQWYL